MSDRPPDTTPWPADALLRQNRRRLMRDIRAKLRRYEARYEIASARVEDELRAGRMRETAEVADWLIAYRTYRALEAEARTDEAAPRG